MGLRERVGHDALFRATRTTRTSSSVSIPVQPVPAHFSQRMPSFGYLTMLYGGVLYGTNPTLRDTRILERVDINASIVQMQFFLRISLFATLQARRAARGLPRDAAPRPTPSLLTLLPSPTSLPPFTPSIAPGVGVGGCGLGGREGGDHPRAHQRLFHFALTQRPLDARSTLARRSLDIVASTLRARR